MADKLLIECPESVIMGGAGFVNLRHKLEDLDPALRQMDQLFDAAIKGLENTQGDLKAAGMKRMQYGVALAHLHEARANINLARGSAGHVMAAHEHMANGLTSVGIAQPTDKQLLPHILDARDWR